jgi:uncharacterized glyoxalase superfamily protein PhnB
MLKSVSPKLPMRNKQKTIDFYKNQLGFEVFGVEEFDDYLMVEKDDIEIHFFLFEKLNPYENYGQIYIRVEGIDTFYQSLIQKNVPIHPNGKLETKSWGQREFSMLDPDFNLLTFGEAA